MKCLFRLFLTLLGVNCSVLGLNAPYQVTIWLKPGYGSVGARHVCNGAIVHEKVILTAASCMLWQTPNTPPNSSFPPSIVSVVAGDLTYSYSKMTRDVMLIEIAAKFNRTTLENDIALLTLNESLPLATRSDIKWIILDDNDRRNHSCIANFNNSSSYVYTTGPSQPIFVMDNKICSNATNDTLARQRDICSLYVLNPGVMCDVLSTDLKTISDRGTPLVCDSKLFGVLSMVMTPQLNPNCSTQRKLNAYYSKVSNHLSWIYQVIAAASTRVQSTAGLSIAPPFEGKTIPSQHAPTHLKKVNGARSNRMPGILQISFCVMIFVFGAM